MRIFFFGFLIILIVSCSQQDQNKTQVTAYFNLKDYFENEADRLTKNNLKLNKSVAINGVTEQKMIEIKDYKSEFSSFIASDINKASWRGAFAIKKEQNHITYSSNNEKIPVKKVEITYQNNKLTSIRIITRTDNILYHSTDSLSYFPDSLYEIKKLQKIKLIKEKRYVIRGRFCDAPISNLPPEPSHSQPNQ